MQDGRLFFGVAGFVWHLNGPTNNQIGDPDMTHVQRDSQKCTRWQTSVKRATRFLLKLT